MLGREEHGDGNGDETWSLKKIICIIFVFILYHSAY
jgi:hypothetical protein